MKDLLLELIPHAPNLGLYAAPHLPADKVRNALEDYAHTMHHEEVLALYDATLLGNAKDGAVFAADRFIFQNNDLEQPLEIRYEDLVRINVRRRLLGGKKVVVDVNRGRATITVAIDFSGKPDAAAYVGRFLHEAMLRGTPEERARPAAPAADTDRAAVEQALGDLRRKGLLSERDHARLLDTLRKGEGDV